MNPINWKLIFLLSLLGLIMAIATVSLIPAKVEPFFWLVVFIASAFIIAKNAPAKYFLHGFLVSIINCIWITAIHTICFKTYAANHAQMMQVFADMPMADHPRRAMILFGPFFGIACGIVLGLFSWIASKIVKK